METRICSKCKQPKPATLEFFHASKRDALGLRGECIACRTGEAKRTLSKAQPELLLKERRKQARYRRLQTVPGFIRDMLWGYLRHRQEKNYGTKTNLTVEYLEELWAKQRGCCYWTGIKLLFGPKVTARHPQKASVDRLDNTLGYVKGNIAWASNFANRGRGNLAADLFIDFMQQHGIPIRHALRPSPKESSVVRV